MLNAVQELKNLVQSLIRYAHFLEKFVALDNSNEEILKGGGRRGNKIR